MSTVCQLFCQLFSLLKYNWPKNSKAFKVFHLYQKKGGYVWNLHSVFVLLGAIMEAVAPWAMRLAPPSSFPGNYTLHQAAIALKCKCEHLWFISIYCVHTLARNALKYQKNLTEIVRVFVMLRVKLDAIKCFDCGAQNRYCICIELACVRRLYYLHAERESWKLPKFL